MQAILLAAGESSRFFPFNGKHKSLVKIAGDPIITHTVRSIKRAGITDIVILTGKVNDCEEFLGNGKKYGVKISYATLDKPTGMGDGVLACLKHIKGDFYVINPQHVEFDEVAKDINRVKGTNKNVVILAKEGKAGVKYGAIKIDGDKVLEIKEKPTDAAGFSNYRIAGVYFINQEFVDVLKKTKKGHYSFEDALDAYAKMGNVRVAVTTQPTVTLKYPWDLLTLKDYILSKQTRKISAKAQIDPSAQIIGNVVIEEGATVAENAVIKGPAYIGKNSFVGSNALVRNGSDIEEASVVGGYMELKNSLIFEKAKTHSGHLEDSILGEDSRLGAFFTSANVKLDRSSVTATIKGEKVDSGMRSLGVIIGAKTYLGARVTTMPGIIIGNHVSIGPSTTVMKNIESDTIYYTKFAEVVEKNKDSAQTNKK